MCQNAFFWRGWGPNCRAPGNWGLTRGIVFSMSHSLYLHLHGAKFSQSLVIFNGIVLGDTTEHQAWGTKSIFDMYSLCMTLADPQRHQTEVSQTNNGIYCKLNLDFDDTERLFTRVLKWSNSTRGFFHGGTMQSYLWSQRPEIQLTGVYVPEKGLFKCTYICFDSSCWIKSVALMYLNLSKPWI